jgi:GNAT superfamily N-acetyltransferase
MSDVTAELQISLARTDAELQGILQLQRDNLKINLSSEESQQQGFVTLRHDLTLLRQMNHPHPHVIAKTGNQVVAYALVMMPEMAGHIPELTQMFERIGTHSFRGKPLTADRFAVMGQVCVARDYRSTGLFAQLYQRLTDSLKTHLDCLITDIAAHNTRSLRAHEKVGFTTLDTYPEDDTTWHIVLLDLNP